MPYYFKRKTFASGVVGIDNIALKPNVVLKQVVFSTSTTAGVISYCRLLAGTYTSVIYTVPIICDFYSYIVANQTFFVLPNIPLNDILIESGQLTWMCLHSLGADKDFNITIWYK